MKTMKLAALDTTDEFWLLLVSDSRVICEAVGTTTCETGGMYVKRRYNIWNSLLIELKGTEQGWY